MVQLARYVIGLTWIYQGLIPKLLYLSPQELAMTGSLGFSADMTLVLIQSAGVAEILFGLIFIQGYQNRWLQLLNLVGLTGLLLFTAVMTPQMLLGAFNPLTTNIPLMVLGYFLFQQPQAVPPIRRTPTSSAIETKQEFPLQR